MDSEYIKAHNRLWNTTYEWVRKESVKNHSGEVILVRVEFDEKQKPGNYPWTLTYIPTLSR